MSRKLCHMPGLVLVRHIITEASGTHFLLDMWHFFEFKKGYMVVQKIKSSINNHCSIWLRMLSLLLSGWGHENKPYKCADWVGVCENELPLSPDPSHAYQVPSHTDAARKVYKGITNENPFIKERCFSWKAKRCLEIWDMGSLKERFGIGWWIKLANGHLENHKLFRPKVQCQFVAHCPSAPNAPFHPLLCDSGFRTL